MLCPCFLHIGKWLLYFIMLCEDNLGLILHIVASNSDWPTYGALRQTCHYLANINVFDSARTINQMSCGNIYIDILLHKKWIGRVIAGCDIRVIIGRPTVSTSFCRRFRDCPGSIYNRTVEFLRWVDLRRQIGLEFTLYLYYLIEKINISTVEKLKREEMMRTRLP